MKTFLNRICLTVAVLLSGLTASAYDFEVDGIQYTIISTGDLTCEVSGYTDKEATSIIIPQEVSYRGRQLTVIAIGSEAFSGSSVREVRLPETVKELGRYCFYGSSIEKIEPTIHISTFGRSCFAECEGLQSIDFGNEIVLDRSCFKNCKALKEIILPKTVEWRDYYGDHVLGPFPPFEGCDNLETLEIYCNKLPRKCFQESSLSKVILGGADLLVEESSFMDCVELKELILTSSYLQLAGDCFKGCTALKNLNVPSSVFKQQDVSGWSFSIGWFENCTSLEAVSWDAEVMPMYTFKGCSNLKSLIIGPSTKEIYVGKEKNGYAPERCFEDCPIEHMAIQPSDRSITLMCVDFSTNSKGEAKQLYRIKNDEHVRELNFFPAHEVYLGRSMQASFSDMKRLTIAYEDNLRFDSSRVVYSWSELEYLKSEVATPPVIPDSFTTEQYLNLEVLVPLEALDAYKEADVWKNFWNLKGVSGVTTVVQDGPEVSLTYVNNGFQVVNKPNDELVSVFSIQGVLVTETYDNEVLNLIPGIYLVKIGEKTFKILVK